jgi:hypothetical protein
MESGSSTFLIPFRFSGGPEYSAGTAAGFSMFAHGGGSFPGLAGESPSSISFCFQGRSLDVRPE